ncbi:MAG: type IV pilin N-terminal domain-containing protein, partial [Bacilli bacterium]|nr:type IV pilin N-terminal domain-containing protein [Bacilli bacterium]
MYKQINDAVSPVIGVMLMLVLTIILAAMVAAFSGGIMGEQNVAPQVALDVSYTASIIDTDKTNDQPDYRTGYTPNNGLTFRLIGGEAISLKDITLQLKNDDSTITFDSNVYRNDEYNVINTNSLNILTGSNGINETYFAVPTGQDFVIT